MCSSFTHWKCSVQLKLNCLEPQKEEGEFQEARPEHQSRVATQRARDRMRSWCKELKTVTVTISIC